MYVRSLKVSNLLLIKLSDFLGLLGTFQQDFVKII